MKKIRYFLYVLLIANKVYSQDYSTVSYGPETRQFLDIYIAPSSCPTPVYFDAHGNGGTTDMQRVIIDSLKDNGISIVAWESLTSIFTHSDIETGWDDSQLMFNWVKANATTYNFDTTNFIIGGSSRGSVLSWKYAHNPDPNIKGLYMYNALPNGIWADSTWWYPPDEVNIESPPIFFVYRYEPGVSFDGHDPNNGIIITDKYDALGIGDRDTLIHSIEYSGNRNKYQFLVDFALSVIEPCWPVGFNSNLNESISIQVYPNPFIEQITIDGLTGGENVTLRNYLGQIIRVQEVLNKQSINVKDLPSGIYFLTVKSGLLERTFKLLKE